MSATNQELDTSLFVDYSSCLTKSINQPAIVEIVAMDQDDPKSMSFEEVARFEYTYGRYLGNCDCIDDVYSIPYYTKCPGHSIGYTHYFEIISHIYHDLISETGIHRITREYDHLKNDKIRTSRIKVTVMPYYSDLKFTYKEDIKVEVHNNDPSSFQCDISTNNAYTVKATHLPTGITVVVNYPNAVENNVRLALNIVKSKVLHDFRAKLYMDKFKEITKYLEDDIIRDYMFTSKESYIVDHRTKKKITGDCCKNIFEYGHVDELSDGFESWCFSNCGL